MTQSTWHGKSLRLLLTPMQVPQANPAEVTKATLATDRSMIAKQLFLYPGEPSEMVVHIENLGNRAVRLEIKVEGDCPSTWYTLGMEGDELAPRQRMEAVLRFQTPPNFFEEQRSFVAGQSLNLNYNCRIYVYYTEVNTERQLVETAAFDVYVRPPSLYLNFLPQIYSEVDFIGRFLKIFEQAFEPAVQTLDVFWSYLNPLTTAEAFLPFLAYWVAWPVDHRWSEQKQRHLIRQAMEIYRWRGTKRGLRLYLHLYTDLPLDENVTEEVNKHICIEEVFGNGFVVGDTDLGIDSIIGGGRPLHFIVRLRPLAGMQIDQRLVREIIEQEKPAFCTYDLYIGE